MSNIVYPFTVSDRTLSVLIGSDLYQTDRTNPNWVRIVAELKSDTPDPKALIRLMDPMTAMQSALDDLKVEKSGRFTVKGGKVFFENESIHNALSERILDIINEGLPVDPWIAFAENLYANPLPAAKEDLYAFLENGKMPFTNDGCFIAYKIVSSDYKDLRTGTFDNSIGKIVSMPRKDVDGDRTNTCSRGLHFCSKDYLPHYGTAFGNRIVLVKINPADVVSIPVDYNRTKGRTWRYQVVGEITREDAQVKTWTPVVNGSDVCDADLEWDDLTTKSDDELWCDDMMDTIESLNQEVRKIVDDKGMDPTFRNKKAVEIHSKLHRAKNDYAKRTENVLGGSSVATVDGTVYDDVRLALLDVMNLLLSEVFMLALDELDLGEPLMDPKPKVVENEARPENRKKASKKAKATKTKTPSLKTLEKERKTLGSWEAVARQRGVTPGALRGWLKRLRKQV